MNFQEFAKRKGEEKLLEIAREFGADVATAEVRSLRNETLNSTQALLNSFYPRPGTVVRLLKSKNKHKAGECLTVSSIGRNHTGRNGIFASGGFYPSETVEVADYLSRFLTESGERVVCPICLSVLKDEERKNLVLTCNSQAMCLCCRNEAAKEGVLRVRLAANFGEISETPNRNRRWQEDDRIMVRPTSSPHEEAIVDECLNNPSPFAWGIYADILEEEGREEDKEVVRKIRAKFGEKRKISSKDIRVHKPHTWHHVWQVSKVDGWDTPEMEGVTVEVHWCQDGDKITDGKIVSRNRYSIPAGLKRSISAAVKAYAKKVYDCSAIEWGYAYEERYD